MEYFRSILRCLWYTMIIYYGGIHCVCVSIFHRIPNNSTWRCTISLVFARRIISEFENAIFHTFVFFFFSYLNGFGPLQIGGVQTALTSLFPKISFGGFRGCIRDITDNGLTYDLLNPLLQVNTELGCKLDNNACPDCSGHGYCEPLWTNSICVCDLGYTGPNCNQSK